MLWLIIVIILGRFIQLLIKGAFCGVGGGAPGRAAAPRAAATAAASAGDPEVPAAPRCSDALAGRCRRLLGPWLRRGSELPPPGCQSVPGHVCLSGRLSLSPAAHRGLAAVARSALRAAPRGGPSATLGPTSEAGTFSRSSAPASRSATPRPGRFPRTEEGVCREGARGCYALSLLSASPASPSLSLRAGLRVSSRLTAPTCPSPSQPASGVPGSRAPSSPPPRAPALPRARPLPVAPAVAGPRPGWRQCAGRMWRGSCSAGRLQPLTRHTREMAAVGRLRGPGLGHQAQRELAEPERGHLPGVPGARGGAIRPLAGLLHRAPG